MSELLRKIFVYTFIFLISAFVLFPSTSLEQNPLHADEPGWMASGYIHVELLANLLIKGKLDLNLWKQQDSYFNMNGNVGKWILGFPIWSYFHTIEPERTFPYHELTISSFQALSKTIFEEIKKDNEPIKKVILLSRTVSVLFGALCCVVISMIARKLNKPLMGFTTVILLLSNNLFIKHATKAIMDIYYLFFLLCLCLILAQSSTEKSKWAVSKYQSILSGVFSALAGSVKIIGLLVGGFFFILILFFKKMISQRKEKLIRPLISFILSAIAIVYLLNPQFWVLPLSMRESVQESKVLAASLLGRLHGDQVSIQLSSYPHLMELIKLPHIFLEWNYIMKEQQENISKGIWGLNQQEFGMRIDDQVLKQDASRLLKINKHFFYLHSPFPFVQIPFFIFGIIFCLMDMKKKAFQKQVSISVAPFLFFVANYIFILFTMKLNWDRYFLTTVVAAQMLTAIGIVGIGKNLFAKLMGIRKSLTERTGVYDR